MDRGICGAGYRGRVSIQTVKKLAQAAGQGDGKVYAKATRRGGGLSLCAFCACACAVRHTLTHAIAPRGGTLSANVPVPPVTRRDLYRAGEGRLSEREKGGGRREEGHARCSLPSVVDWKTWRQSGERLFGVSPRAPRGGSRGRLDRAGGCVRVRVLCR